MEEFHITALRCTPENWRRTLNELLKARMAVNEQAADMPMFRLVPLSVT